VSDAVNCEGFDRKQVMRLERDYPRWRIHHTLNAILDELIAAEMPLTATSGP
jgi:hypothetical protein